MTEKIVFEDPHTYSVNNPIHTAFFGRNGVGKTTFAGKSGLRTVLLDCGDAGAVTLRKVAKDLKIVKIRSILHYLDTMEKLQRIVEELDLVVADTLSGLQAMAIREVKGRRGGDMNQRKWGQVGSKVIECIVETRNFPKDVIYLAQEKYRTQEDAPDEIGPALTPSIVGTLSSNIDWIGWIYLGEDKDGNVVRKIDFRIREGLEVKDRASIFPKVLVNATYLNIRDRITKELTQGA